MQYRSLCKSAWLPIFALLTAFPPIANSAVNSPALSHPTVDPQLCNKLLPRLPEVSSVECLKSGLIVSNARSVNGFPILVRDFTATTKRKTILRVLVLGGIHGDELSSSATVMKWLALVPIQNLEYDWKFAPIVNPDGLLANTPQRVNAHGIDLNRNFPTPDWQREAPKYWAKVTRSDPRRFPGKTPISEPESKWVYDTIENFKPDVIISVHAPFGVLDFDGPAKPPHQFGRLMFNRVGVYPGSLGNYSGLHRDIPVVTIELPNSSTLPSASEIKRIWVDMNAWIKRNVRNNTHIAQK